MKSERKSAPWGSGRAVALLLGATACTHVGTVTDPRGFMATSTASDVWVTGPDNQTVEIVHAKVTNDTLHGFTVATGFYEIPMADVRQMRARVPAPGRTALAVGAGVVAAGLVLADIATSKHSCEVLVPGTQVIQSGGGNVVSAGVYQPCGTTTGP
jgi:hypothetical protein